MSGFSDDPREIAELFSGSDYGPIGILARAYLSIATVPRSLTAVQLRLLRFLAAYIEANGYAPSFEEIALHFNYRSLATVYEHLSNLEQRGWLKRSRNEVRSMTILHFPKEPAA